MCYLCAVNLNYVNMSEKVIMASMADLTNAMRLVINEMGLGKPQENEWLTRDQACQRLGISTTTLWRLGRDGVLHATKVGGKILYKISENPILSK